MKKIEFQEGQWYQIFMPLKLKPYKIHICAIVDDVMVVYKWYGKHKQHWHYVIEHRDTVEAKINIARKELSK